MSATKPQPSVRYWPALVVLALAAVALAAIWLGDHPQRQVQVIRSAIVAFVSILLLVVWLALFSRLRIRLRLLGGFALVLLAVAASFSLRFRGVSGDMVPLFEWRWSATASEIPQTAAPNPRAATAFSAAADYPQFLGPRRDGTLPDVRLARGWNPAPRLRWRKPVGAGWSGFAVASGIAVTLEQHGDQETVNAYDLVTGGLVWSHADEVRFFDPLGGPGPRATPSIDSGRVFAVGGTGILNVLDLQTGGLLWSRDILADAGAPLPEYGVSASPLVLGQAVIVSAGGGNGNSLVAYDVTDGNRVWSGGSDRSGYGSPMQARIAGREQILIFNGAGLSAHAPTDGTVQWFREWPGETQNTSQPLVLAGDRVFLSSGYGVGGKLFRIAQPEANRFTVELLWETRAMKAKFTNVVYRDGFLYGLDDGILTCIDVTDGRRVWKRGRYGHGQLILVGDLLLLLAESGEVALVEAKSQGYTELGRFEGIRGKTWNHPALALPYLLVRNDREAACYELPLAADAATN